jgi:hypothetical protein
MERSMDEAQVYKRVSLDNILFSMDFSWASQCALPFVRQIAAEHRTKVTALHVAIPDVLNYAMANFTASGNRITKGSCARGNEKTSNRAGGPSSITLW